MIDTAQLREALAEHERVLAFTGWHPKRILKMADAARVLLAQREAGALIITPDENGKWPQWALTQLGFGLDPEATLGHLLAASRTAQEIDALRDAKPDGET